MLDHFMEMKMINPLRAEFKVKVKIICGRLVHLTKM